MTEQNASPILEYVIVIYCNGVITTVIGFADWPTTQNNFIQACQDNSAQWAQLLDASSQGDTLARFQSGSYQFFR